MKIGIVCYPTFGGSGVVATELGMELAKEGHEVHFITYAQPFRLSHFNENIYYHEVSIYAYPLFDYLPYESALASKLVDVVKFVHLDVLHVHYAIPHASAALMAKNILASQGIYIPFITTLHGTDITLVGRDPSFEPVIRYSMEQSDALTAVSESLKKETDDIFKLKKEIIVIPNFINLEEYKLNQVKCHREHYAGKHEKILIHISNFRKVKRIDDVLKVFDKLRKETPCKLILVGDGPERANIEKLCRELGTCNDIISLGKVNDPKEVLSISDVFILPSETESFGLSALEAMALGKPVITTNGGGLPELNKHGYAGFTCNVGDVDAMADYALQLFKNEELYKQMSSNALETAKRFDIKTILPLYEDLYQSVIKNNKIPV